MSQRGPYCVLFATIGHILIRLSTKPKTALKASKDRAKLFIIFIRSVNNLMQILQQIRHFQCLLSVLYFKT